jgi:hypothetical protein
MCADLAIESHPDDAQREDEDEGDAHKDGMQSTDWVGVFVAAFGCLRAGGSRDGRRSGRGRCVAGCGLGKRDAGFAGGGFEVYLECAWAECVSVRSLA